MDEGETVVETLPIRHSDLWFSDGSVSVVKLCMTRHDYRLILLEIVPGAGTRFFACTYHCSRAIQASSMIYSLFPNSWPKIPHHHTRQRLSLDYSGDVEGRHCQVLTLCDSAEDVANLLPALVDGLCYSFKSSGLGLN